MTVWNCGSKDSTRLDPREANTVSLAVYLPARTGAKLTWIAITNGHTVSTGNTRHLALSR